MTPTKLTNKNNFNDSANRTTENNKINAPSLAFAHDHFFKRALSEPKVSHELLTRHVPKEILAEIKMNSVKVENNSFIDDHLKLTETDVLLSAEMKNGKCCYFYFLVEHTTKPDKMLPFRVICYMTRTMNEHIKRHDTSTLPIVYPLVLYGGNKPYTYSMDIFDLFAENKNLAKSIYTKPPQFIDLNKLSDEELMQYPYSGLMEYVLKNIVAENFMPYLDAMAPQLKQLGMEKLYRYIQAIFVYTLRKGQAPDPDAFRAKFLKNLTPEAEEIVMTMMQEIEQKNFNAGLMQGIEKGQQEGRQQGERIGVQKTAMRLLRLGSDLHLVSKVTGLSVSTLKAMLADQFEQDET